MEVLASLIRSSPGIEGFILPGARGLQARVRLYADDTTAILRNLRSLTNLFDCVSVYENGSGAKLNRSKTEAMWLGAWRSRSDEPLGLTWVKKMRILGVIFGTISTEHLNWQHKLGKLEKSLNLWKSRSLSLPGKALIINMLGLSKLVYLARVLTVPAWVTACVNAFTWPFLWGSKMETISRNTFFLKLKDGGINVISLPLKAQALRLAGSLLFSILQRILAFLCLSTLLVAVYLVCVPNGFLCAIILLLALPSRLLFTRPVWIPCQGWVTALWFLRFSIRNSCPLSHPRKSYIDSGLRLSGQGFLSLVTGLSSGILLQRILRMMLFG